MNDISKPVEDPSYRWVILVVTSIILAVTMGQLVNGMSAYVVPLEASQGWNRGDISLINTAGLIGLAIGSLVMGFVAEKYGVRRIALLGISSTGLAIIAASQATELWQFYVLFLIAGTFGGGALSAPLMALVGNWFVRGAGLAIGIASAGQAMGQGGVPFSATFLIEALGWRGAMATQGVVTLVVLLPIGLLLRNGPAAVAGASLSNETPSGLPNNVITAWISVAVIFCCICMAVPLMHLVPLIQGRGFSAPEAGSVLFTMLMVAILGRIAFGKIADIFGALPAYLLASGWQTALVFGFTYMTQLDNFYLFAAVYGFGYAGVMTSILVTVRNLSAPARRASSTGVVLAFAYLGHGIGGWQGGFFFDMSGDYSWTFANAAFAGVINLVIVGSLWLTLNRRRNSLAMA